MSGNHGNLCRDLIGGSLQIKGKKVIDEHANLCVKNANIRGDLNVNNLNAGQLCLVGNIICGDGFWVQRGQNIDGEAGGDFSGFSVSLSSDGNTVAIGANNNDGNGNNSGSTRIYDWNGDMWIQRGVDIDGEAANDQSGYSVSLSADGNTVAIGARYNDGNGNNSGHTRIYDWSGSAWIQRGVDIDGEVAGDNSGYSVSLSANGNTVAIGAYYNSGNGYHSGQTRIFDWSGSAWVQRGADIDGGAVNDQSGYSVSLSDDGNIVAIGANYSASNGAYSGQTRIFYWSGSAWVQRGANIDGEAAGDESGFSVSISADGNTVAIGAYQNDGNGNLSGHTRIFDWSGSAWVQRGVDIDGEAANDYSGYSVSLSADGNIVAIGAPLNDGSGYNLGQTRIYEWSGSAWVQRGVDIDGEASNDYNGGSVSLSDNGDIVAIGARSKATGNGFGSGQTRIFRWNAEKYIEIKVNDQPYYMKLATI